MLSARPKPDGKWPMQVTRPEAKLDSLSPSTRYTVEVIAFKQIDGRQLTIAEAIKNFSSLPLPPREIRYRVQPTGIRLFWKGNAKKYRITDGTSAPITTDKSDHLLPLTVPKSTYNIQVQAIDRFGQESVLMQPIEVIRPKQDPFPDSRHFVKAWNSSYYYYIFIKLYI